MAPNFLHMVPFSVSVNISREQTKALDAETHTGLNFHLPTSQDGPHLGFYCLAGGGGLEVNR